MGKQTAEAKEPQGYIAYKLKMKRSPSISYCMLNWVLKITTEKSQKTSAFEI